MKPKAIRCAVYTRKSTEYNLDLEFNSLHAQREACEAYIKSQMHEGWQLIPNSYDDGAYSGGSLDRPDLHRLLADIAAGRVDNVVVYKVDRLNSVLDRFREAGGAVRQIWSVLRLSHSGLQHHYQHGQAYAQCPSLLCAV